MAYDTTEAVAKKDAPEKDDRDAQPPVDTDNR